MEEGASFLGRPALSTLRRSAWLCVRERDFRRLRMRDLGALKGQVEASFLLSSCH